MVIYLDSADVSAMNQFASRVAGFTTNPSLMKSAGSGNYKSFAATVLIIAENKPVSFEVFSDDMEGMESQAREISSWGENIYVKIPATNTKGESTQYLIRKLALDGIKLNITAVMTFEQINTLARSLIDAPAILSIFCGRIADTGRDPVPFVTAATRVKHKNTQILWASTREVLNTVQAQAAGADIITMTPDLIHKLNLLGKDLAQYSLETVQQFYKDAQNLSL